MNDPEPFNPTSLFIIVLLIPGISNCHNQGAESDPPPVVPPDTTTDEFSWEAAANSSTYIGLIDNYWNSQENYFNYGNRGDDGFQYWPQAHALDVLLDAYQRTDDDMYLEYTDEWYFGVREHNGGSFTNPFYDDMDWNALAMLRAWQLTGDVKFKNAVLRVWNDIKHGWTDVAGGGIMWSTGTPNFKNAPSNGPASILASRLYNEFGENESLEWAKKIYSWQKNTIVDTSSGAVWDGVRGDSGDLEKNVYTYNQGTHIGAALELYSTTDDQIYLNDAIKTADYTLNNMINDDGVFKEKGTGDGGLFKGIFIRYFTQLILEEDLPDSTGGRYIQFLEHNANMLWNEGTNKKEMTFDPSWQKRPGDEEEIDLTVHLSGAMLIEAAALLENKNMLDSN